MPDLTKTSADEIQQTQSLTQRNSTQAALRASLDQARQALPAVLEAQQRQISNFFDKLAAQDAANTAADPTADKGSTRGKDLDDLRETQTGETRIVNRAADRVNQLLSTALQSLEERQTAERVSAVRSVVADPNEMAARHEGQINEMAKLVSQATSGLERNAQDVRNRQQEDRARLVAVVSGPNPEADLQEAVAKQRSEKAKTNRTENRLVEHVSRETEKLLNQLTQDRSAQLRKAAGPVAEKLDDKAVQQAAEAVQGKRSEDRVNAIVGQLTEELNNQRVVDLQKAGIDRSLTFIAGDRIRDGNGAKMTDGVLARQLDNGRWQIMKAFEVKAGSPSAKELYKKIEHDRSEELPAEARQDALQELAAAECARRGVSTEDESAYRRVEASIPRADLDRLTQEKLLALQQPDAQREAGQLGRTLERLSQQRLFLDGMEMNQADDNDRHSVEVRAVVPRDVRAQEAADHLEEDAAQLRMAAEAIVDLLDDWAKSKR